MNREELFEYHAQLTERAEQLMRDKSADYSGDGGPFDNLMAGELLRLGTAEQGVLLRMTDKISRLSTLVARGDEKMQVTNEKVEDTLVDIINYAVIFGGIRCSKKAKSLPSSMDNLAQLAKASLPQS